MLSISTPSGIDNGGSGSINNHNLALTSKKLSKANEITLIPSKPKIVTQNLSLKPPPFNSNLTMDSDINQSDINNQNYLSVSFSGETISNQSMSISENFVPNSTSELMYPMYQSAHVPRRHSTIDSYNSIDIDFQNQSHNHNNNDMHLSLDMDSKSTSMTHFENSSFYQNYYMQPSSKESMYSNNLNIDSFQSFHSIKANTQLPFYSESNALLSLPKKISLYKTELCRTFEETGYCRYGVKCQFAHDKSELRIIPRHPRYKTEICRTFWELGNCPYGKRCCFIHLEAGTLMNGKPPGQAKITSDNQFNGPVYQGFQKDQLVKSSLLDGSNSLDHLIPLSQDNHFNPLDSNYNNINNLSLTDLHLSIPYSPPPSTTSSGDSSFSLSPGFDWMRTRRSQSLSLPSPTSGNWGLKPSSFINSSTSSQTTPISPKGFDIYSLDPSIPILENNNYICQSCSKDSNDHDNLPSTTPHFSIPCKVNNSALRFDNSGHSCNINIEDESSESIMADSLLASLPDY